MRVTGRAAEGPKTISARYICPGQRREKEATDSFQQLPLPLPLPLPQPQRWHVATLPVALHSALSWRKRYRQAVLLTTTQRGWWLKLLMQVCTVLWCRRLCVWERERDSEIERALVFERHCARVCVLVCMRGRDSTHVCAWQNVFICSSVCLWYFACERGSVWVCVCLYSISIKSN